ncbi:unnamed protein product [Durusdinium trenchii]|uniref:Pentatricopeptide repeat-containing protein n=1 Tax=Durusdinium trenchii TaxID=1381693 RepID=A0ABP0L9P1_9DINO
MGPLGNLEIGLFDVLKSSKVTFSTRPSWNANSWKPNAITYCNLISACHAQEWRRSLELFATANDEQQLDVMLFNATLSALPWFSALRLLKKVAQLQLQANIISYNSTLRDSMTWRQNLQQLEALQDLGLTPSRVSYNSAMSACDHDQADAWRSALGLATAVAPDRITCNVAIRLQDPSAWSRSFEFLEFGARRRMESNVITMSSVLSVAEKVSLWKSSLQLMTVAKRNHLEANVVTFNALLSSFPWYQALQLVHNMGQCQVQRSLITRNALLSRFEVEGRWPLALELGRLARRSREVSDVISFNSTISSCNRHAEWQRAVELLQRLEGSFLEPNVISFTSALASHEVVQWPSALLLLPEVQRRSVANMIFYNAALSVTAERWDQALRLFFQQKLHEPVERSVDLTSFNMAILACEKASRWEEALSLLTLCAHRGLREDVITFTNAISACGQALRWREVLQLLQLSSERSVRCNLLSYAMCSEALASTPRRPKPSLRWALGRLEESLASILLASSRISQKT